MKNKYTLAYIGAIVAVPVIVLFAVAMISTTNASVWDLGGDMFADAEQSFTQAQQDALSSFNSTMSGSAMPTQEATYTQTSNTVTGLGASASASSGSSGSASATSGSGSGSASVSNSGYANASASVNLGCVDCEIECDVPAPICTLNVLPSTIYVGDTVNLVWDTTHATAVSIAGIGSVALDGSRTLTPTESGSYTLTATGEGGTATCVKSVQVLPRVSTPAPLCTFNIDPASITAGGATTFTWDTTNATAVSIEGIGSVSLDGTKVVYPTQSRNYILTATGNGGTVRCTDSIQVTPVQPTAVRCDSFTASDVSVDEGDSVVLTWNTTGAESVLIDGGIGAVTLDGNKSVRLFQDTTFILTARKGSDEHKCQVTIAVDEDDDTNTNTNTNINNVYNTYNSYSNYNRSSNRNNNDVSCDSFTVSDSRVEKGDEVTLRWKTSNADDVDIDHGVGDVDDDGSEKVEINRDTTFTLTARDGSDKDTCKVSVRIDDDEDEDDDPRCVFSVSDTSIVKGEDVKLSWKNERTDRLVLKDGSKTLADSKKNKKIDEDVDTFMVSPLKTTEYTIDVYNGNKKETCSLEVKVGSGMVSGISLSQTPYTGFDAGPVLTSIFYGAIVLWGILLAYLLVLKKKNSRTLVR